LLNLLTYLNWPRDIIWTGLVLAHCQFNILSALHSCTMKDCSKSPSRLHLHKAKVLQLHSCQQIYCNSSFCMLCRRHAVVSCSSITKWIFCISTLHYWLSYATES